MENNPKKFNPQPIVINSVVYHPIWGKGIIIEYTEHGGIKIQFAKSVTRQFIIRESHVYGEDHYTHLYIEPVKIVSQ